MSPLPVSLSPHICVLPSPDLTELLNTSSLPPLSRVLQSFSPLPNVTTRTTALTSVSHKSFGLRFSELPEIEQASREDEEQRAARTIDWISAKVNARCTKWISDVEKIRDKGAVRTPWWDELRRSIEGDHIPSKYETWNHPVAVLYAVSTNAPNPLQAITMLHSRQSELPSWVDQVYLKYTLIIHPPNSALSDEEAGALFNAVKKQYGFHTYLLPLSLPSPPPKPVPVPALLPRLHPLEAETHVDGPSNSSTRGDSGIDASQTVTLNTLRLGEKDIQSTARFTREFVVMSLIPWMEKCVIDWNESFSSSRRLPSRLFSSTRRLFGTSSPSPGTPVPQRSSTLGGTPPETNSGLSQHRRLAEFATILGDVKLAVSVWEALRKEGRGGSDMLPLLLAPSPTLQLHASNAISELLSSSSESSLAQLRVLVYAIRWETGIGIPSLLDTALDGERWLVWAAGSAEESPSALLLAHAALLTQFKKAPRRSAFFYTIAAYRMEKCGIKPLTMYFLRRAQELQNLPSSKELSPSFWIAEATTTPTAPGFSAILEGIELPLGRLLYTTGDVETAVRIFVALLGQRVADPVLRLRSADAEERPVTFENFDKVILEDFRVAYSHLKASGKENIEGLTLPLKFSVPQKTSVRISHNIDDSAPEWQGMETRWKDSRKEKGLHNQLERTDNAITNETFWVDVVFFNPLSVQVNLSDLTLTVVSSDSVSVHDHVYVEVIEDVVLDGKESRVIPVAVRASCAISLRITGIKYRFLSLLPTTESLACRGSRLHATVAQRQTPTYGPDKFPNTEVVDSSLRLSCSFLHEGLLVLGQGEQRTLKLRMANTGSCRIGAVWIVPDIGTDMWLDDADTDTLALHSAKSWTAVQSGNSQQPEPPYRVSFKNRDYSSLEPSGEIEVDVTLHARVDCEEQTLRLLLIYGETDNGPLRPLKLTLPYQVHAILNSSIETKPCSTPDAMYNLNLLLENSSRSLPLELTQLCILSPTWASLSSEMEPTILPGQQTRRMVQLRLWPEASKIDESRAFVAQRIHEMLHGLEIQDSDPPPVGICLSLPISDTSLRPGTHWHFNTRHRRHELLNLMHNFRPHIPPRSWCRIFPLFHPGCVSVMVSWRIPGDARFGCVMLPTFTLGAQHGNLSDVLEEAESLKAKRSIYAETAREKSELMQSIRDCAWNVDKDPTVVFVDYEKIIRHDFSKGPCCVPVQFTLRNYSLDHSVRVTLRISGKQVDSSESYIPPTFQGASVFRASIKIGELKTFQAKLWISFPGSYTLGGWLVTSEVIDPLKDVFRTYTQASSSDKLEVTVLSTY